MIAWVMIVFKLLVLASAVWLAFLGQWLAIAYGVGILLFSHFALTLVVAPGALLAFPMTACARRSNFPCFVLLLVASTLYTLAAMTFWAAGSFAFFDGFAREGGGLLPLLLWSASVAIGPWGSMAGGAGDEEERFTLLALFLLQAAYIVLIVVRLFRPVSFWGAAAIVGAVMSIALVYNLLQAKEAFRELADED